MEGRNCPLPSAPHLDGSPAGVLSLWGSTGPQAPSPSPWGGQGKPHPELIKQCRCPLSFPSAKAHEPKSSTPFAAHGSTTGGFGPGEPWGPPAWLSPLCARHRGIALLMCCHGSPRPPPPVCQLPPASRPAGLLLWHLQGPLPQVRHPPPTSFLSSGCGRLPTKLSLCSAHAPPKSPRGQVAS